MHHLPGEAAHMRRIRLQSAAKQDKREQGTFLENTKTM